MTWALHHGDCREIVAALEPESVDACVTDPPYELGFMGRGWDSAGVAFDPATWATIWRALKPGAHLVAFGGSRTMHRIACAIEDGGGIIRDTINWCYWSGFPKSLNVSKAIDAAAGAERSPGSIGQYAGRRPRPTSATNIPGAAYGFAGGHVVTSPATPEAARWAGWGTALKPAVEPAILARKPFAGTVADNVERYGTAALNVDGCRIGYGDPAWPGPGEKHEDIRRGTSTLHGPHSGPTETVQMSALGRWPANLYHCAKPTRAEREAGCEGLPARTGAESVERAEGSAGLSSPRAGAGRTSGEVRNVHPTLKPIQLMRWLVRLVTPPGGVVLDPFAGSGTTGIAALWEGFNFIGCELNDTEAEPYATIARARLSYAERTPPPALGCRKPPTNGGDQMELFKRG